MLFTKISSLFGLLVWLSYTICSSNCATFTIYEDAFRTSKKTFLWWGGGAYDKFSVGLGECMTLGSYNDKASSIDPHGGCIKVWRDAGCSGPSMIITEQRGCSKNLATCDISNSVEAEKEQRVTWDNSISSISTCSKEEAVDPVVDNGDLVAYNPRNSADFYKYVFQLVTRQKFSVWLCLHTDCKQQERIHAQARSDQCANFGLTWDRQVSAVYTIYNCVELFEEKDCRGESIRFRKSVYLFSYPGLDECKSDRCRLREGNWNNKARSMKKC
ncbi:uncharacterized protein LOC118438794 [Folsomia candida]|uniref:Uncharacterized protein n=1 Tax=Folsomia candida TaxID=158441 RepID=A0A226DC27_FOLCA|nr:uncharacterized protein LOC118438794 [Folsomia candida]OXA42458.1 hypothetical protein Fcan01_22844 [Folsomia candida]